MLYRPCLGCTPRGRNIAYDLALVKLGPHTKFGEDWSNGLAVHWIQTDRQLDKYILDTPVSFKNILNAIPARHFPKASIAERNLLRLTPTNLSQMQTNFAGKYRSWPKIDNFFPFPLKNKRYLIEIFRLSSRSG